MSLLGPVAVAANLEALYGLLHAHEAGPTLRGGVCSQLPYCIPGGLMLRVSQTGCTTYPVAAPGHSVHEVGPGLAKDRAWHAYHIHPGGKWIGEYGENRARLVRDLIKVYEELV